MINICFFLCSKLVVDFTASWCGPCKSMEPAIEEYATIYEDVQFIKIDVDMLTV